MISTCENPKKRLNGTCIMRKEQFCTDKKYAIGGSQRKFAYDRVKKLIKERCLPDIELRKVIKSRVLILVLQLGAPQHADEIALLVKVCGGLVKLYYQNV
ncbi:hypothetical protein TNIN_339981 [Trichonephila inaurata madagascariensis]|uniref:Uncharacterized protein n=1 Tax=Trichonephila inaurata madagascariensis TaxID=2747483 RepID=A0A8X6XDS7_9ARAC|nr:hypothetical protein TNIN_339981 [Trichonephila inaurata madagascariensis]